VSYIVAGLLTVVGHILVLSSRQTFPAHFKHRVHKRTEIVMLLHILLGVFNIVIAFCLFFLPRDYIFWGRWIILVIDSIHAFTVYHIMFDLFGQKRFTVPGYVGCNILKTMFAVALTAWPGQYMWLIRYWFILSTYVWVRLWRKLTQKFDILRENQYTITTTFGFMTTICVTCGPAALILLLVFVFMFNMVFNEYFIKSDLVKAHSRNFFSDKHYSKLLDVTLEDYGITKLCPESLKQLEEKKIRFFFDMLEPNEKDMLEIQKLILFLETSGVGSFSIKKILERVDPNGSNQIDFRTWSQYLTPICDHLLKEVEELGRKRATRDVKQNHSDDAVIDITRTWPAPVKIVM